MSSDTTKKINHIFSNNTNIYTNTSNICRHVHGPSYSSLLTDQYCCFTWSKFLRDNDDFVFEEIKNDIKKLRDNILIIMLRNFDSNILTVLDDVSLLLSVTTIEGFTCFLMMRADKMHTLEL